MSQTDKDTKKDFDEAYQQSSEKWWPYWAQAKKDIRFRAGDQWTDGDKMRLKRQSRDPMVFNRVRRMCNLISGYERKNRLTVKMDPIEGADRQTADQLSGAVQYVIQRARGYKEISDAFDLGSVTCGLNLLEIYIDFSRDPVFGDLRYSRQSFNQFLLDPFFTKPDLSDCSYYLTRNRLSLDQIGRVMPKAVKDLKGIKPMGRDQKFPDMPTAKDFKGKPLYRYDRFFKQDSKKSWLLINKQTGEAREIEGSKAEIEQFLAMPVRTGIDANWGQMFDAEQVEKSIVKLAVIIEDQIYYDDEEPLGIEDYPVVPWLGYWIPELDDWSLKLCGVVRDMRDPQTESNRRRLKMLDIMDTMIRGRKMKKSALVDPRQANLTGPVTLFVRDEANMEDIQDIPPSAVGQGVLESIALLDKDVEEIPGGNETLMGLPSKDDPQEAWVMGKLRMQAGLTIFEPLMDNYRESLVNLATKTARAIQVNYGAQKIQRILNKPPSPKFYDSDFTKYDLVAVPGLFTESQRALKYASLLALSNMPQFQGKIPASVILEASDLELSQELIEGVKKQEQMQQQIMMAKLQLEGQTIQAETRLAGAGAELKKAQAQKAMADAAEKMAKIKQIPEDRMHKLLEMAMTLDQQGGFGLEPAQKPEPEAGMPVTTR